jgi:arylsulfatase A-like enzyme
VAQSPYSGTTVKGSLYQGGINVPMFIAGKGVNRLGEDNSLICSTDMYSTIAELAGANESAIHDSKSFKPLLSNETLHRTIQYAEMNNGTLDSWTISNGDYKLIVDANGNEELYRLGADPYESNNLLNGTLSATDENGKAALETALLEIRN